MNIDEFCAQFGSNARNINDVMRQWQLEELDGLLRTLEDQHDQLIGSAVIVGDALHGGTLLDQIPRELKEAFANLMHEKADSYEQMRQILLHNVRADNGGFLSFDDRHVLGFISKLKGQIGENLFQHHVGSAAALAESGIQEGWDIAVKQADGLHQYVQVKLYDNPYGVIRHMLKVQQKVMDEKLLGVNHEVVKHVYFAVPEDIKDDVLRLAEKHPGLSSMMYDKSIPISSHGAADIVREGMSNVGPDQLGHFFHELLGGAIAAGSLHAIVNGFLWYNGSKEFSAAFASAAASTAISTTGIGMGLLAETLCHVTMLSGAVGIGSRLLLGRLARSRWSFAEFLEKSIAGAEARTVAVRQMFAPEPEIA
jgi:hypothetical protein